MCSSDLGQGAIGWALGFALFSLMALGVSGAVTALGDTLFPVHSTAEAFAGAMNAKAHFLVRLRLIHPFLAVSVGLYLLLIAGLVSHLRPSALVQRYARFMGLFFASELAIGLINKALHAPISLQLVHLFFADGLWVMTLLLVASALAEDVPLAELSPLPSAHADQIGRAHV